MSTEEQTRPTSVDSALDVAPVSTTGAHLGNGDGQASFGEDHDVFNLDDHNIMIDLIDTHYMAQAIYLPQLSAPDSAISIVSALEDQDPDQDQVIEDEGIFLGAGLEQAVHVDIDQWQQSVQDNYRDEIINNPTPEGVDIGDETASHEIVEFDSFSSSSTSTTPLVEARHTV